MGKLLKTKSDLPEWFPLEIYSKKLTPEEWLSELVLRYAMKTAYLNTGDKAKAKDTFLKLFVLSERSDKSLLSDNKTIGYLWGVKAISAYEAAYIANMLNSSEIGTKLISHVGKLRNKENSSDLLFKLPDELNKADKSAWTDYVDWSTEPHKMPDVLPRIPVSIDLDQDDESLKLSFEVWLAGVREDLGPAPKPFKERDYEEWNEFGLLPAFDLQFYANINDVKFTDNLIANAIWPNSEVDTTERIRKVTRPKISQIFDEWSFLGRLWRQLELEKSIENFVIEKTNTK